MTDDNILKLSCDNKGHHMIILIIKRYPAAIKNEIFDYIMAHFGQLARDKNGLCVMKELIHTASKGEPAKIQAIMGQLQRDILGYAQHEFGNYVVQHALKYFPYDACKQIFDSLQGNFTRLSMDKYSSNLIEFAIQKADDALQAAIIQELFDGDQLHKVVRSQFGNYVIQGSIENYLRSADLRMSLIEAVIDCLGSVNDWKVQEKWGTTLLRKYLQAESCQKLEMPDAVEQRRLKALEALTAKMEEIEDASVTLGGPTSSGQRRRMQAGQKKQNQRQIGSQGRWGNQNAQRNTNEWGQQPDNSEYGASGRTAGRA